MQAGLCRSGGRPWGAPPPFGARRAGGTGEVNDAGLDAEGFVGDADPAQALEDALNTYPADEVIVVNPEADAMGRLERSATARAEDATPIPFTEIHVG